MMSGTRRDTALHLTCFSEPDRPLYTACSNDDVEVIGDLLSTSDVDLQTVIGSTSLHMACMKGHVEATRLLLSVFARTDITDNNQDVTPAMVAQQYGFTTLLPYLRLTLTESRDNNCISTRVTDSNIEIESISLSSIADAQHHKNESHKSNQVIKSTSTKKRLFTINLSTAGIQFESLNLSTLCDGSILLQSSVHKR
jgi:ankyrin repeat protein